MILNTTYTNKDNNQLIDDLVGKVFSFRQSLKMGGTGSKRMIIDELSPNMTVYLADGNGLNYANIELRPYGILVRINKGLQNFTWVIPYYQLVIYKTEGCSIHAQGRFIHFRNNITYKENRAFLDKLLVQKAEFMEQYSFQF